MRPPLSVLEAFTGKPIGELSWTTEAELETAVDRAYRARQAPLPKHLRIQILEKIAQGLQQNLEDFAHLIAKESGKPLRDARIEVDRAINGVNIAVAGLYQWHGREVPMGLSAASTERFAVTRREPLGLVLAISAFNHPLNLLIHQSIPALAIGCPVLIKPSLKTPLTAIKLMELYKEAGLPDVMCQVLLVPDELTYRLSQDPRLALVSFIGSAEVGWRLKAQLAPGTQCLLEHGGTAPAVIAADAILEPDLKGWLRAAFYHAGQVCVSLQNIFVHETRYDEFCEHFVAGARMQITGNPLDLATDLGPLIRPTARERIIAWTQEAISSGAKPLLIGQAMGYSSLSPTILTQVPSHCRYRQEEIFGPAVSISSFSDEAALITELKQSRFAFQAALFTQDLDRALRLSETIEASTVLINDHTSFRTDWMPFGGFKQSGMGVGGILDSLQAYSREKLLIIHSPTRI